ncbi:MAG: hypothetical protein ACLFPF_10895 [Halanaerobiales bacterium]
MENKDNIKGLIFDTAWEFAERIEEKKEEHGYMYYPVSKVDDGVWFGNVSLMVKIQPCVTYDGFGGDFTVFENYFKFLKNENKKWSPDIEKLIDDFKPENVEGNEIEFTDVIVPLDRSIPDTARVYKHSEGLSLIDNSLDHLTYNMSGNLSFISKGLGSNENALLGLLPGEGTIKDRCVVICMSLNTEPDEIEVILKKLKTDIENIYKG